MNIAALPGGNAVAVMGTDKIITMDLAGKIPIPNNANINNYKSPGWYYCNSGAASATIQGIPRGGAFDLVIDYPFGNAYYIRQKLIYAEGDTYYRYVEQGGDYPVNWQQTATTNSANLTLLNGWVSAARSARYAKSGRIVTIEATAYNPAEVAGWTLVPFNLPYAIIAWRYMTLMSVGTNSKGYKFQFGGGNSFAPAEAIPANTSIDFSFSYTI